jgi:hypothetical protein
MKRHAWFHPYSPTYFKRDICDILSYSKKSLLRLPPNSAIASESEREREGEKVNGMSTIRQDVCG